MPAINTTSYRFGRSPQDAAAFPASVTLEGGELRNLQVLVPGGTLRPIDPETNTTIPLTEIRDVSNGTLSEYPETNSDGEWNFRVVGWPVINLGVTGPEDGAVEKVYLDVVSGEAVTEVVLALLQDGSGTFTGSVDWATQVTGKPTIPSTAEELGAMPSTARGDAEGVAPLAAGKVPVGFLPTGTDASSVAPGLHTHTFGWPALPTHPYVKLAVVVLESAPGVFPDLPSELLTANLLRIWQGTIRPSVGMRTDDWWANKAP